MERLAYWPLAELTVKSVRSPDSRSSTLKIRGSIVEEKGRVRDLNETTVSNTVHVDQPIPVLYDPDSGENVALESIKFAELEPAA